MSIIAPFDGTLPDQNDPDFNETMQQLLTWLIGLAAQFNELTANDFFSVQANPWDATQGRLMQVAAFGVGESGTLSPPPGNDMDAVTVQGIYRAKSDTVGGPPGSGSIVVHYPRLPSSDSGGMLQMGISSSGHILTRSRVSADPVVWSDWVLVYSRASILGSVTEVDGLPTGALIERGGNANGEYVRFADGTQICTQRVSVDTASGAAFHGGYRGPYQAWTFPAAFAPGSDPTLSVDVLDGTAFGAVFNGPSSIAQASWNVVTLDDQASATRSVCLKAMGRWF